MSAAKHTPGPWVGEDEHGKFNGEHEWSAEHDTAAISTSAPIWAGGEVIALVVTASGIYRTTDAKLRANARLIAAAPELLEALLRLLSENDNMTQRINLLGACEQARAAIAKATGQQGGAA